LFEVVWRGCRRPCARAARVQGYKASLGNCNRYSIRLTELQDKELRTFIRTSNGPDINYVLTYSGTADTDLAKRRNAFLDRYFHAASFSSEPDPKLSPDLIVVREKTRFEVHGGQTSSR
jgi:hypothetical protein